MQKDAALARCVLPAQASCLPTRCVRPPLFALAPRRPLPAAPDGTSRTEGSLLLHLDPHIPFIPAFLLNFVLGVLAP